jgi:hypothetical protein
MELGCGNDRMKNPAIGSSSSHGHSGPFHGHLVHFTKVRLTVGHILLGAIIASAALWVGIAAVVKIVVAQLS